MYPKNVWNSKIYFALGHLEARKHNVSDPENAKFDPKTEIDPQILDFGLRFAYIGIYEYTTNQPPCQQDQRPALTHEGG